MFFILQCEGDLYMSLVLLRCVIHAVFTQLHWTHLALPTDGIHQICHCWDSQCCIYLAGSPGITNYVSFRS